MSSNRRRHGGEAVKIVITGPFAAGKTTLIRTISEITVLSTERDVSDATRATKNETTVAMDFGRITVDRDLVLYLFGTPGQERFDFMWEILSNGMIGYVLLVDPTRPESLAEARDILAAFGQMTGVPYVIAVNRVAAMEEHQEQWLRAELDAAATAPVVPCDATDRESVKAVLLCLLHAVLDSVAVR
jgi:uncharacterized protein